jgi:hypothetical protein
MRLRSSMILLSLGFLAFSLSACLSVSQANCARVYDGTVGPLGFQGTAKIACAPVPAPPPQTGEPEPTAQPSSLRRGQIIA